ncbi:MAG: PAS domain-containing protein [Candidatus Lokiarchaeota archaeon]|nr:PAS domain-containing protein [Candidatus Lokiarchaeota archaeon]
MKIEQIDEWIESNEFLSNLLKNMSAAVFIVDENVRVVNVNKGFTALFQKPEEEVLNELCGNAIGCVFPIKEHTDCGKTYNCSKCDLRKGVVKSFQEKCGPLNCIIQREFFIKDRFVLKYFYVTIKYLSYKDLNLNLVMIYDVTEIEAHRRKLKELNNLKNEFFGMAAHDLRTPIAEISMASSALINYFERLDISERDELLRMIQKSSKFMLKLVNNLLDVAKIEAGKLELDLEELDYSEFIIESLALNRFIAEKKSIDLQLNLASDIPKLKFDPTRIRQVLNNLVSNAIKFTPPDSKINVEVEFKQNQVITKVIDEGPGISEDNLPKLFMKFQKLDTEPTGEEKGTGLGLAIAKKIVEKHGGTIGVTSKLGVGSKFYFSLPI